jgi:hypothetical protein
MTGYATARQNGWMSTNDIRELENLDRIAPELGGDLYLINGAMMLLGSPQQRMIAPESNPANSGANTKTPRKRERQKANRQEDSS